MQTSEFYDNEPCSTPHCELRERTVEFCTKEPCMLVIWLEQKKTNRSARKGDAIAEAKTRGGVNV